MSTYLKLFGTYAEYSLEQPNLTLPNVSVCRDSLTTAYFNPLQPKPTPTPELSNYFTIESLENNNTIRWVKSSGPNVSLSYSTDDGETWTDLTLSGSTDLVIINTGDKVIFKGVNDYLSLAWDRYNYFVGSKTFKIYGNIMSLLWGDDFEDHSEFKIDTTHNFCGIFRDSTNLIDASGLLLPANTCNEECYNGMFRGCTNLVVAPELPAITPAKGCYSSMFEACINLEEAPEINLTTMAQEACQRMFCMDRSNKLLTPKMTKSPILRCSTGVTNCYKEMFKGNGNLVEITCLMTTNFACSDWLANSSSTGTFYKDSNASWSTGNSGIPSGWTAQDYIEPS